ncbi:hypothetical protein [Maribacter sp.]|uniref:hypothetical protein n=1 Tax=Maribacter sp. TaxID=1897614 RepID=UPI00177400FB|nr:hypothetical protein [Maribacter sp.]HDZ07430.1 hypothetical protein [Maribacter sp.]HEA79877.1 hypothetical protein [Maribacter sp.]
MSLNIIETRTSIAPLDNLPAKSKLLVNTINQYSYCISEEDSAFKKALLESDVLLPDGVAIVLASKWLNGITVRKLPVQIFMNIN